MGSQDKYRVAILSAFALALHGFETVIPSPVPWLRLGLSNIVTLVTLYLYGLKPALMVTMIRVLLGSLFIGTFLGPAFFLSLGGGLAGTLSMGLILTMLPRLFSPLGVSLIGALFHNIAQLFIAYFMFIQRIEAVLIVAPVLIAAGTATGIVNGIAARHLILEILKSQKAAGCQSVNDSKPLL